MSTTSASGISMTEVDADADSFGCGGCKMSQPEIVKLALTLPVVSDTCQGLAKLSQPLQPYIHSTVTKLSPIVDSGLASIKTNVGEKLPNSLTTKIATAKEQAYGAAGLVDSTLCTGLDTLVEKVPVLKESTSSLYSTSKATITRYCQDASAYLASFTLAQLALRIGDSSLETFGNLVQVCTGFDNLATNSLAEVRKGVKWVRQEGAIKNGSEKMKVLQEAPLMEAIAHAFNLKYLMSLVGASEDDEKESRDERVPVGKMITTVSEKTDIKLD